ncbi:MAG: hypothetical protein JNK11_04805 [Alphaproteobacteria bacterium]|nr:hypothetical protein [Alphaproteobacteria bacterium]
MKPAHLRCGAILMALLLSSCVLGAGKGPITLSQSATEAFQRYKATPAPLNFLVSEDGRFAHFDFCRQGQQQCTPWTNYDLAEDCERRSRKKCYVFAQDGRIVWDGEVTFAGGGAAPPPAGAPTPAQMAFATPADFGRFKAPKVGTRIETQGRGYYQVTRVDGMLVTTANAAGATAQWYGGTFFFDRSNEVSTDDASAIWRAKPGDKVEVTERRGRDSWKSDVAFDGAERMTIDGKDYEVLKFTLDRRSVNPDQGGQHVRVRLWYAPDVGFLVRREIEQVSGPPMRAESWTANRIVVP